jgi:hypothetical protein
MGILFDQQNGDALFLVQTAYNGKNFLHQQRRQTQRRFIQQHQGWA